MTPDDHPHRWRDVYHRSEFDVERARYRIQIWDARIGTTTVVIRPDTSIAEGSGDWEIVAIDTSVLFSEPDVAHGRSHPRSWTRHALGICGHRTYRHGIVEPTPLDALQWAAEHVERRLTDCPSCYEPGIDK